MMAKSTRLVRDDAYEEMGAAYQCVLVDMLDGVLKEHGVDEQAFGCADAYFSGDPAGRIETGGFATDDDDDRPGTDSQVV